MGDYSQGFLFENSPGGTSKSLWQLLAGFGSLWLLDKDKVPCPLGDPTGQLTPGGRPQPLAGPPRMKPEGGCNLSCELAAHPFPCLLFVRMSHQVQPSLEVKEGTHRERVQAQPRAVRALQLVSLFQFSMSIMVSGTLTLLAKDLALFWKTSMILSPSVITLMALTCTLQQEQWVNVE